ncbi:MAG: transmembrane sensor [Saprospiraceae bacterium]|jgi:transmembrane sensor
MQEREQHSKYSDLISSYLSGNASDREVRELEAWVLAAPENKQQFIASKKTWMLSGMKQNEQPVNVEQFWKETSEKLFKEAQVVDIRLKRSRRSWLAIAATVAVLIVAGVWMFRNGGETSPMIVRSDNQTKSVDLPDGSVITLNQSSSLSYVISKNETKRKVSLEGDAFFEVARDEVHPFIIDAQGVEIEVLGTSFYVDARDGQAEIQVIVNSGSVAVRSGNKEVILAVNEKAVFNKKTGELIKGGNDDPNFMSITSNALVFNQTKLEEVVFALNRQFKAEISFGNDLLKNCELTATYKDKSLEAILKIIEGTLTGIEVKQTGQKVVLKGTSCD